MPATLGRAALLAGGAIVAAALGVAAWQRREVLVLLDPAAPDVSLDAVERAVARLWPVPSITTASLAARLAAGAAPPVFDVRESDEFDQAHIAGAVRLDPGLSGRAFLAAYEASAGDGGVFVCAVGVRSSRLLARIRAAWPGATPPDFANLRGGMFRWAAEGRPMIDAGGGAAATVHPYGTRWGALLGRTLTTG